MSGRARAAFLSGIDRQALADAGVLAVLCLIGSLGWMPVFGGAGSQLAALGGLLVGFGLAWGSRALRLNSVTTVLAGIICYFLFGTAFALPDKGIGFVIPTFGTIRDLAVGSVFAWRDVITLSAPVDAPDYVAVLPFLLALAAGTVSGVLAVRWLATRRRTLWRCGMLLIAPFLVYLVPVVFGTREPFLAAWRGLAVAVIALVWLGWRRPEGRNISLSERTGLFRARLVGTAAVAVAAVAVGGVAASALTPPADQRFVLRDAVQPPFDPEQFSSPLSGYRVYTKMKNETDLFTVTGLHPGDRLRLAAMDTYDGHLWNVAGPDLATDGSGTFELAGRTLPEPELATSVDSRDVSVTVSGYSGPWLPTVGIPRTLDLEKVDGDGAEAFRYNRTTQTAVLLDGVHSPDTYRMSAGIQKVPGDEQLDDVPVASVQMPPVDRVPDVAVAKAKEYAGGATAPIEQLRAIESTLVSEGYLSHGLETDTAPSRAGHGADRIDELFSRPTMIGDEEQYAAAMALMARSLGYPARVVMGFEPENVSADSPTTITGDAVTAWVEVPFEGVGWIPFFPTPDETDIPQDQNPKPQSEPQPQVRQPPRSDKKLDDLLTDSDIDDKDEDDDEDEGGLPLWLSVSAGTVGGLLLLYLVPLLIVAAIKRRRAMKRRRAEGMHRRASGAWDELLDRHAELGYRVPIATRTDTARTLAAMSGADADRQQRLDDLAHQADRAVFGADDVPQTDVDELWDGTAQQARDAAGAVSWWRRQLSRFRVSRAHRRRRAR